MHDQQPLPRNILRATDLSDKHSRGIHLSGEKRAHKLKKNPRDTGRVSLGHPAGQTGVYRPVSQGFPVRYYRKADRKGHFWRDTGRVSQGHPAIQGVFRNFMCFFLMCLFCSLIWQSVTGPLPKKSQIMNSVIILAATVFQVDFRLAFCHEGQSFSLRPFSHNDNELRNLTFNHQ